MSSITEDVTAVVARMQDAVDKPTNMSSLIDDLIAIVIRIDSGENDDCEFDKEQLAMVRAAMVNGIDLVKRRCSGDNNTNGHALVH